jgi:hypothetical protein
MHHAKDVETSRSLSMFASGSSKRSIALSVIHAETLFQDFVTEHNLPLAINHELWKSQIYTVHKNSVLHPF